MTTFDTLGLSQNTLKTLAALGFETPTPIQAAAIPLVLSGRDLVGLAQTGTGKTAAFGLPLMEQLLAENKRPEPRHVRALILAPTRELVNQIATNLKGFMRRTPLTVGIVVGGASINMQAKMLAKGLDVLVSTPGRLLDLLERRALVLSHATRLVLDEADQMLDLGFIHDLRRIVKLVPAKRQTLLFSATMPKQIAELAGAYLTDPVQVEVTPPGKAADKVSQSVHFVAGAGQKAELLKQSLTDHPDGLALVFARTKHGAEKLMKHLTISGFNAASIHGNKSQGQRERALKAFRNGETRVLVATDVAARGIDVPGVTHVYNYDLPEVPDAYVHRIGRTARAGRDGQAIAFCAPDEIRLLRDIERLMGIEIDVASGDVPADRARPTRKGNGGGRGAGQGRGQRPGQGQGQGQRQARGERHGRGSGHGHGSAQGRGSHRERSDEITTINGDGSERPFRRERNPERASVAAHAGDQRTASDARPAKRQHRKGQGPAAQAAHEANPGRKPRPHGGAKPGKRPHGARAAGSGNGQGHGQGQGNRERGGQGGLTRRGGERREQA